SPSAPMAYPLNMLPSASARIAGFVKAVSSFVPLGLGALEQILVAKKREGVVHSIPLCLSLESPDKQPAVKPRYCKNSASQCPCNCASSVQGPTLISKPAHPACRTDP